MTRVFISKVFKGFHSRIHNGSARSANAGVGRSCWISFHLYLNELDGAAALPNCPLELHLTVLTVRSEELKDVDNDAHESV